jgi:hypothetical protein
MAYQERGSGPPHFDGKNYQMWSKRMGAFLSGKGQILWDVTVDTGYVQPMDFLALGSRDRFDANNKAVDYLFRALCQPKFDRVHTEHLACRIWTVLKEALVGNAQVQARMYATVGVLDRQTYQGVPEVVDCAVRIVIGRPRTQRYAQGHGTRDLYRFGLPRWRTLRPVWGIKYGALRLVLG